MTTINQRLQSENVGLIFDNPLTSFIGPVRNNSTEIASGSLTTGVTGNQPLFTFTLIPNSTSLVETKIAAWNISLGQYFVQRLLTKIYCNSGGFITLVPNVANQNTGTLVGTAPSFTVAGSNVTMSFFTLANPTAMLWEYKITSTNSFGLISG
jgi:hypothetical protein